MKPVLTALKIPVRKTAGSLAAAGLIACCLGQSCNVNPLSSTPAGSDTGEQVLASHPDQPGDTPSSEDPSQNSNPGEQQPEIVKVIDANEGDTAVIDFSEAAASISNPQWSQTSGPIVTITQTAPGVASVTLPEIDADATAIISYSSTQDGTTQTVLVQINIHDVDSLLNDLDFAVSPTPLSDGLSAELAVVTLSGKPLPPATYSWDLGDGSVAEGAQVNHSFGAGTWTVTLCVAVGATVPGCKEKSVNVHAKGGADRPATVALSGKVLLNGVGLAGATVSGGSGITSATTAADGAYSITAPVGWSGSLRADLSGYAMAPAFITLTSVQSDSAGNNFAASVVTQDLQTVSISGSIKTNGVGQTGVSVAASNGGTSSVTDVNGNYTVRVPTNWSGNVVPQKIGYVTSPASYSFLNLTANQTGKNFTATRVNQPPVANAGSDRATVSTGGSVSVALDGSASLDPDGTINSYAWTENGVSIATGVSPTVSMAVGSHTVQLTITDNEGATSQDTVVMTVLVASSYYVSNAGNDTWSGKLPDPNPGHTDGPFKTIQRSVQVVQPGDAVMVRGGVYNESVVIEKSGAVGAPIVFRAANGETPAIDSASTQDYGIIVHNCSWIVIDGISIRNARLAGVWLLDFADNATVRNCRISGCYIGIQNRGGDDALIEHNELTGNVTGINLTWRDANANMPERNVVQYNLSYDNGAADPESGDGIDADSAEPGTVFAYNICWNNRDDGIDIAANSHNCLIHHNLCFNNGFPVTTNGDGNGIKVSTKGGGGHMVHHNIVFGNRYNGFDQDIEPGEPRNSFYNNSSYGNTNGGLSIDAGGRADAGNNAVVLNNIMARNVSIDYYASEPDALHIALLQSDYNFIGDGKWQQAVAAMEGIHSMPGRGITGDPLFVNPSAAIDTNYTGTDGITGKWTYIYNQVINNFSPQTNSPCRQHGVIIPGVTTSATPNMGAVE